MPVDEMRGTAGLKYRVKINGPDKGRICEIEYYARQPNMCRVKFDDDGSMQVLSRSHIQQAGKQPMQVKEERL